MFSHLCHSVCDRWGVDCKTSQQLTSVKERRAPPGELGGEKHSSRRRTGNLIFIHKSLFCSHGCWRTYSQTEQAQASVRLLAGANCPFSSVNKCWITVVTFCLGKGKQEFRYAFTGVVPSLVCFLTI